MVWNWSCFRFSLEQTNFNQKLLKNRSVCSTVYLSFRNSRSRCLKPSSNAKPERRNSFLMFSNDVLTCGAIAIAKLSNSLDTETGMVSIVLFFAVSEKKWQRLVWKKKWNYFSWATEIIGLFAKIPWKMQKIVAWHGSNYSCQRIPNDTTTMLTNYSHGLTINLTNVHWKWHRCSTKLLNEFQQNVFFLFSNEISQKNRNGSFSNWQCTNFRLASVWQCDLGKLNNFY